MRFEGVLSAWNQDAGYGTIRPTGGGDEVFVGLAAFPTDGEGPRLDEPLSFEIVSGRDGRKQAVRVRRVVVARASPALRASTGSSRAHVRQIQQAQRRRRLGVAAGAVMTLALVLGAVHLWKPAKHAPAAPVAPGLRR